MGGIVLPNYAADKPILPSGDKERIILKRQIINN